MPRVKAVSLQCLPGVYAVSRLAAQAPLPLWADGPGFVSISRSSEELSIVCLQARVPPEVHSQGAWLAMRLVGPFAFDETGVVLAVVQPLAEGGLGVFVVSTFDGDHLLIRQADAERATALLSQAGHRVLAA